MYTPVIVTDDYIAELRALSVPWGNRLNKQLRESPTYEGFHPEDKPVDLFDGIMDGTITKAPQQLLDWMKATLAKEKIPAKNSNGDKADHTGEKSAKRNFKGERVDLNEPYLGTQSRLDLLKAAMVTGPLKKPSDVFNHVAEKPDGFHLYTINNWLSGSAKKAEKPHWDAVEALIKPATEPA